MSKERVLPAGNVERPPAMICNRENNKRRGEPADPKEGAVDHGRRRVMGGKGEVLVKG